MPQARRFIGRDDELARLAALAARSAAGEPCVVVVAGAAGVGKSTLLTELAQRVTARVLVGACVPLADQGVPYQPFLEIVRQARTVEGSELLRALGAGSDARPEVRHRFGLFQAVLELFARLAAVEPVVVVVEDLHWSDGSTRDLLAYLVANLRDERLLVVATYRTEGVHRDHPLRPMLAELIRSPRVDAIELEPFGARQVAEQIEHLTGEAPSASTLAMVMERTQGNPYFVEQLADADCLDGRPLPASLRELLLVRAEVVSPATRRTLGILSLSDGGVDDVALARVAAVPVAELRTHLREAIDRRLLVATPSGPQFAHALLREALHDDLLPGERADHHAAYADALGLAASARRSDAGLLARLAHHRAEAGRLDGAVEAWLAAADAAEAICAFAEARRHLSCVIANWDRVDVDLDRTSILAAAAEDAFLAGEPVVAADLVERAIALVDEGSDPLAAGVLHERLARYVRDTDRHERILELVERAVALVPAEPPSADRARVLAGYAGQLMTRGRYVEARAVATEAADLAALTGSTLAEADARNTLGVLVATSEDVAAGLVLIQQALALARRCGDAHQQMRAYWNTLACRFDAGDWERTLSAFREAEVVLPRLGQAHLLPDAYAIAADLLMRLGRWVEAQRMVDEAGRRFPATGEQVVLLDLLVERGETDAARAAIDARNARNVFVDQEQQGWPLVNLARLETWEGHHAEARTAVDAALAITAGLDTQLAAAYALATGCHCDADAADDARRRHSHDDEAFALARISSMIDRADELMARPGPADGWKREGGAMAMQCHAEASRARGAPDAAAWSSVTETWEAMKMPYHAAYAKLRLAEALDATDGDRRRVAALARDVRRVATELGARPLGRLVDTFVRRAGIDLGRSPGALGLTAREHEVLAMLATGATNRQLATALFISEKTAGVHVSNILRKLGVANRSQAVAVAHREGLA